MKVLMLPDYSRFNPYQRELTKALERQHVDVTLCNFGRLPLLRAIAVHGKPDVLHIHWTDKYLVAKGWPRTILKTLRFFIELLIVKAFGVKIVWTVHNLSNHEKIKSDYETTVGRFLVRLFDRFVVHCSYARDAVIQRFSLPSRFTNRIHVIPHGNYVNCYENRVARDESRKILDYADDMILFLYFGTIRPYKGILELVNAFHKVENLNARLLIVGNPANEAIKEELHHYCQIDSRVKTYLQYVPESEIQVYMNSADVAVFPYTDILTSGSVLLAMSFGRAIIVPDIGCISETLDALGSFLYDPEDEEGILKAINSALVSNLKTMGLHNREKANEFEWDEIARQTLDVYCASITKV